METIKGKQLINSAQISDTQIFMGNITPTDLMMGSNNMPGNAAAMTPPVPPPPSDVPPTAGAGGNESSALCVSKACGVLLMPTQ